MKEVAMNNNTGLDVLPARNRGSRNRIEARAYYADAETPKAHTRLANRWLEDNETDRLPQAHHDVLRSYGLKRCSTCRTVHTVENFSLRKNGGRNYQCKPCAALRGAKYRADNPEKAREITRRGNRSYRQRHPWAYRLSEGYRRAVKRGVPVVEVTEEQLLDHWKSRGIDPARSYYSGELLTDANRSLDHLDPLHRPGTCGHTVENLFPCTVEENTHHKRGQNPLQGYKTIREKLA